jgi:glutathione S-transferase
MIPGGPRARLLSRRHTVPVLDLDGERLADSTRIIAALEERHPDPPLYPPDPAERERALTLEEFFDEEAGHDLRRVAFFDLREHPRFVADFLSTDQPRWVRAMLAGVLRVPGSTGWANRRYGINDEEVAESRPRIVAALDRITAEVGPSGYMVGSGFSVADLTAASLLYPLAWPPEFQYELPERARAGVLESVADHPANDWIRGIWREHRGRSHAIAR